MTPPTLLASLHALLYGLPRSALLWLRTATYTSFYYCSLLSRMKPLFIPDISTPRARPGPYPRDSNTVLTDCCETQKTKRKTRQTNGELRSSKPNHMLSDTRAQYTRLPTINARKTNQQMKQKEFWDNGIMQMTPEKNAYWLAWSWLLHGRSNAKRNMDE